jgi:hypothetical protein
MALVFALVVTAFATTPSARTSGDCLMCHPQAHVAGWEASGHGAALTDGQDSMTTCEHCHQDSFCAGCHATGMGQ